MAGRPRQPLDVTRAAPGRAGPAGPARPGAGPEVWAAALQRSAGNRALQRLVVQREAVRLGPVTAATYGEAVMPLLRAGLQLAEMSDSLPEGNPDRDQARALLDEVRATCDHYRSRETEAISPHYASQTRQLWREIEQLSATIAAIRRRTVVSELEAAQQRAQQARSRIDAQRETMDRRARQAYLTGSTDLIGQVASWIGFVTDVGLGLRDLSRQIAETIGETTGYVVPPAARGVAILNQMNRVLAGFNLVYSSMNMGAPTELQEATNRINGVTGAFSSGGTLLGLAPHIGLYANLYLVPMTQLCLSRLNTILDHHLHELNEAAGHGVTVVEASNEPGGWPVFTFMWRMMRDEEEPSSVPEEVGRYFFDNRDPIGAATRSQVPIRGVIGFRTVDPARFPGWAFDHRHALWRSFYGAMRVPPEHAVPSRHR